MVSHTALPDRTTTHRAASSASRSVTSRRHRSSRSHTGGSSHRVQNEFPNFAQTGDVEIVVIADGLERRYTLHRLILSQCSGFFEAGTSEEWSKEQTQGGGSAQMNGSHSGLGSINEETPSGKYDGGPAILSGAANRCRWRYELDWGGKNDETPMLVQRV